MPSTLSQKLAYNTIAQVTGKVIGMVFGLLTIAVMTRYLGQHGFGEYTTIITFLQFFAILVDLGLTLTTAQMISQPGADERKIMSNILSLRVISALVFLSLAPVIAIWFPYPDIIKIGIILASVSFFFTALFQVLIGVFQKYLVTQKAAWAEVITRILLFILVLVAAWLKLGLLGILTMIIVSNFVQFILYYWYARPYINFGWQLDLSMWGKIWSKTWPIFTTIAFNLIYFKTDTLILSLYRPLNEVGLYGAAYKVLEVIITIPFMFCGLLLPLLTKYWADNHKDDFKKLTQNGFDALAIIAIPMIAGTMVLAKPLMVAVSGTEFALAGPILQILIIATAIIFLNSLFSHAIIAINKQRAIIPGYILTAVISIFGYMYFIPRYSYFGAAWMTVATELLIAIIIFRVFYKTTNIRPKLKITTKAIMASIVMGVILHIAVNYTGATQNIIIVMAEVALGTLVYFLTLYLLKGIDREFTRSLLKR